jgi:hypothetical protein
MKTKSKRAKTSARRVIKSSWPRHAALSDTMRIILPKDNPFREGTGRFNAFEALRRGKTVGKALSPDFEKGKTGTTRNERRFLLRTLVQQKVAKVA